MMQMMIVISCMTAAEKIFKTAGYCLGNGLLEDSERRDLFPCARAFLDIGDKNAEGVLGVHLSAQALSPRQFRLQVYLFIMVIIQGEGGGTNAN